MAATDKQTLGPARGALGSVEIVVLACRCRCGQVWITRNQDRPRVCPKCKSANWDRPKLYERGRKVK
jgi:predicted Zn-ribbon and HTH transcriptional regulator